MTDAKRLAAIKARAAGTERYQPCGVCMGHSPSWDGHDAGCRVSDMDFLIREVEQLADELATRTEMYEQVRETGRVRGQ